ncbi:MAG: SH3 domain-containing protein [Nitratireductor sp.]|nr:SH3 domain-containing protein [Nitratireductor sp.]
MRKFLLALTMLFGAFIHSATSANAAVATGTVNMRTGPGTNHAVVAVIPRGAPVAIVQCTARRSWCQVHWGPHSGWVSARYLGGGPVIVRPYIAPRPYVVVPQVVRRPSITLQFGPIRHHRRDWLPYGHWHHPLRRRSGFSVYVGPGWSW